MWELRRIGVFESRVHAARMLSINVGVMSDSRGCVVYLYGMGFGGCHDSPKLMLRLTEVFNSTILSELIAPHVIWGCCVFGVMGVLGR